ncbi:MAG: cyclopropane-fatty-acyl-phospholipid synthase family protein [Pseudomonadota bacterium]
MSTIAPVDQQTGERGNRPTMRPEDYSPSTVDLINRAILVTDENRRQTLSGLPIIFRMICSFLLRLQRGGLILALPNGRVLRFQGHEEHDALGIICVRDYGFARRTLLGGDIAFFEAYADDQWDTPDLAGCLYVLARNADQLQDAFEAIPVVTWLDAMRHNFHKNTKAGSKKNIMAHYDLGNAFYEQWLDPSMTYSSALFLPQDADLTRAQENKYAHLAEHIDLQPGETVLEIGSGWGGFAEYAAKHREARVTGITISEAQYEYARKRIFQAGLNEKVDFQLRDYRDVDGQFDKVASIEMFEAVGKEYWPTYFAKVHQSLRPGGVAGFQVITIADRFFKVYERSTDFIQRYVFPGGMLPSPNLLREQIEAQGLKWQSHSNFGVHYADTLKNWHERFLKRWDDIRPLGFDDRFRKLWRFYLAYCEAGFRAQTTDVYQLSAVKT